MAPFILGTEDTRLDFWPHHGLLEVLVEGDLSEWSKLVLLHGEEPFWTFEEMDVLLNWVLTCHLKLPQVGASSLQLVPELRWASAPSPCVWCSLRVLSLQSSLVVQQVKDLASSEQWHGLPLCCSFYPWPGKFHMLWAWPKKKKKKRVLSLLPTLFPQFTLVGLTLEKGVEIKEHFLTWEEVTFFSICLPGFSEKLA